jgi:hypothetical protein
MPGKSRTTRVKRSRREGHSLMLRETDATSPPTLSPHAAKKSRHNAKEVTPPRRNASRQAAPGEGKTARRIGLSGRGPGGGSSRRDKPKPLDFTDARQARIERSAELVIRRPAKVASRRVVTVMGRKKPPSEMLLKRKGGPKKRLPLHGD